MPEATTTTATAATWTPIATLLIGFVTSQVADWFKDRRTFRRERDARSEARRDASRERRNTFQRDTLLSLQDATIELMRTQNTLHLHELESFRRTGKFVDETSPADANESNMMANARTALLIVRVHDEEIRDLLKQVKNCLFRSAMVLARTERASKDKMAEAGRFYEAFNQRIGQVIRELDADATHQ